MGWGYGIGSDGREIGYNVIATCDQRGCEEVIDRGLGYVCGKSHGGGDFGCGRYFCYGHLRFTAARGDQMCAMCARSSGSGIRRKHLGRVIEADDSETGITGFGIGGRRG